MKKYRWNLALLSRSAKRLNTLVRAVRERFEKESSGNKIALKVDLDPFGMY
jgi:primosomal protein N'